MFFGMGKTRMGDYDFSSWTVHMAFIIIFSNIWGLIFHEWKGSSKRTHKLIILGIFTLVASICVVGVGNYLKKDENQNPNPTQQSARVIETIHSQ
jgi:L-rhamnose-H+ transport protein